MRLVALSLVGLLASLPALAQDLPPGPGAAILVRACSSCHDIGQAVQPRLNKDGWSGTVDGMIANGASMTDDEKMQLVDYLATNFGPPQPASLTPPAVPNAPPVNASTPQ